jgi:hypothetical protein
MLCTESDQISAIKAIGYEMVQQLSPQAFLNELRFKHIIIADYNLPHISFDRQGFMSLNSLKEFVNIESTSLFLLFFHA